MTDSLNIQIAKLAGYFAYTTESPYDGRTFYGLKDSDENSVGGMWGDLYTTEQAAWENLTPSFDESIDLCLSVLPEVQEFKVVYNSALSDYRAAITLWQRSDGFSGGYGFLLHESYSTTSREDAFAKATIKVLSSLQHYKEHDVPPP